MSFKYIAGDFPQGTTASGMFGQLMLNLPAKAMFAAPETVPLAGNIHSIDILTEENKNKLVGKAGWGLVGLAVFGPAGALAGLLLGGKKKEVSFVCELKDGKKFIGTADPQTYKRLLGLTFGK